MDKSAAIADAAPPPPYNARSVATSSRHVESGTSTARVTTRVSKETVFLRKAQVLRKAHEAESLRVFLLALLKIDYDVNYPRRYVREDADLRFGRYYDDFARSYKKDLKIQAKKPDTYPEMDAFLKIIDDLLEVLNLKPEHVKAMLRDYVLYSSHGRNYISMIATGYIWYLPYKLLRDRDYIIDAVVPKTDLTLRAELHKMLQREQSRLFSFVQGPKDFQLTGEGERRFKREKAEKHEKEVREAKAAAKRAKAAAKEEQALLDGDTGRLVDRGCIQS